MNQEVLLDFEISAEQISALNLHSLFKQKGFYGDLEKEDLESEGIDKIQVWFQIGYNDNTYDVDPVYFDLIKNNKIVRKVKADTYYELEIPEYSGDEYCMQSFIITTKML